MKIRAILLLVFLSFFYAMLLQRTFQSGEKAGTTKSDSFNLLVSSAQGLKKSLAKVPYSETENQEFKQRLQEFIEQAKNLDLNEKIEALKKIPVKVEVLDDLFILSRNLKLSVFHLYKTAWNYKWMTVASLAGQLLNDLENTPFYSVQGTLSPLSTKIEKLVQVVAQSLLSSEAKAIAFGQIETIQKSLMQYKNAIQKKDKILENRQEQIELVIQQLRDAQDQRQKLAHNVESEENQKDYLYFALGLIGLVSYGLAIFFFPSYLSKQALDFQENLRTEFKKSMEGLKQEKKWFPFLPNSKMAGEFRKAISFCFSLFKEHAEFLSVSYLAQSQFSRPFCILNGKGEVLHKSQGLERLCPSEIKCATYAGEIIDFTQCAGPRTEECLLKSGESILPISLRIQPFRDEHQEIQWVLIEIEDLRDRERLVTQELERQMKYLHLAAEKMSRGELIQTDQTVPGVHQLIQSGVHEIHQLVLSAHEKVSLFKDKSKILQEKIQKEIEFKQDILKRIKVILADSEGLSRVSSNLTEQMKPLEQAYAHLNAKATHWIEESLQLQKAESVTSQSFQVTQRLLDATQEKAELQAQEMLQLQGKLAHFDEWIQSVETIAVNQGLLVSQKTFQPQDLKHFAQQLSESVQQMRVIYEALLSFVQYVRLQGASVLELSLKMKDSCGVFLKHQSFYHQKLAQIRSKMTAIQLGEDQVNLKNCEFMEKQMQHLNAQLQQLGSRLQTVTQIEDTSLQFQINIQKEFETVAQNAFY